MSGFAIIAVLADPAIVKPAARPVAAASSMVTGIVAGTPIAVVRKTGSQYIGCVKEFKKDSNTYKFWGAVYSAPVAVVSGLVKGTTYGPKNAIRYSTNKPLSKDSFSLSNLESKKRAKPNLFPKLEKPESQPWGREK